MNGAWFLDTLERVVVTFLEAAVGAWIAVPDQAIWDSTVWKVGAVAAAATFLKCLAATRVGSKDSASLAG